MLSGLILVHELGHYLTARYFKVPIKEFALGMGPKIFWFKTKKHPETVYSLRAFPIGGFVSMVGEDSLSDDPNGLSNKPVWQKMIITAAGAIMNILTGFILMLIVVLLTSKLGGTTIAGFAEGAVTPEYGLRVGDEIIRVENVPVHVAGDLSYEIMRSGVEPVDITVKRNGEKIKLENVEFVTYTEQGIKFGMPDFYVASEAKNLPNVLKHTLARSASAVKMIWDSLIDLIGGKYSVEHVSGPVGVTSAVGEAAKGGASQVLFLAVVIAMNLGVFNLLPLPALDGGRLIFHLVELIRGKPVKPEFEGYVHFAGIVLLMTFMLAITFKDIINLF